MKVLVLGGKGMLGHKLVQIFQNIFDTTITIRGNAASIEKFGIFEKVKIVEFMSADNFDSVLRAVSVCKPNVIVNAIGAVKQLPNSKDTISTLSINSIFPHKLEILCRALNARLITISTDCVFNGKKGNYTECDTPDAEDLYGKSKNLGEVFEENCLTIRTSIIGRELDSSHGLVEWFLSNKGKSVKGYKNAIFSGFPTIILAGIIAKIIEKYPNLNGLYHISSEPISKLKLISMINDFFQAGIQIEVEEDFIINRSLDSTRFRKETGFVPESWENMIKQMSEDATPYSEFRKIL